MSGKKEVKAPSAPAGPSAAQAAASLKMQLKNARKKARIERSQQLKGPLKVPHGTARAKRREGLVRHWRTTKGAKQMLPPAKPQETTPA